MRGKQFPPSTAASKPDFTSQPHTANTAKLSACQLASLQPGCGRPNWQAQASSGWASQAPPTDAMPATDTKRGKAKNEPVIVGLGPVGLGHVRPRPTIFRAAAFTGLGCHCELRSLDHDPRSQKWLLVTVLCAGFYYFPWRNLAIGLVSKLAERERVFVYAVKKTFPSDNQIFLFSYCW